MSDEQERYVPPHEREHLYLLELGKFPPLTSRKVRNRYRDLVKTWRHDTARYRYKDLIREAEEYFALSQGDSDNAHLFYFQRNKNVKPDDFIY